MASSEELITLYQQELKPRLEALEGTRRSLVWLIVGGVLGALVIFAGAMLIPILFKILVGLGFVLLLILAVYGYFKWANYRQAFKDKVVIEIIRLINPEYNYQADRQTDVHTFNRSGLTNRYAERVQGDDFVSGKIEKTDFEFSEVNATYSVLRTNGKGETRTEWKTLFSGIFFHADFNKEFSGQTYVLPDTMEKFLGAFGQNLQRLSGKGQLVRLENPDFEKEFVVHSSDQIEARYILTPVMMEAMLHIKRQQPHNKFRFSFVGSRVYCGVDIGGNLFEPRLFTSGVNYQDIAYMRQLFQLIETIIQEMNLNTRIWTKV